MMEKGAVPVSPDIIEHVEQEPLDFLDVLGVPPKVGKVLRNVRLGQFLPEEIRFVEKQDYWNVLEAFVVNDRVEDVAAFLEAGCSLIFHNNLEEAS